MSAFRHPTYDPSSPLEHIRPLPMRTCWAIIAGLIILSWIAVGIFGRVVWSVL